MICCGGVFSLLSLEECMSVIVAVAQCLAVSLDVRTVSATSRSIVFHIKPLEGRRNGKSRQDVVVWQLAKKQFSDVKYFGMSGS